MASTTESVRVIVKKVIERVAVRAYLSSDQLNLTGGSWSKVNLNSVSYDLGKNFDITTNFRFTAPVTGLYSLIGLIHFVAASVVADRDYGIALYKNGVAIKYGFSHASLAGDLSLLLIDEVYLVESDYIELYCNPDAGVSTVDVLSGEAYTNLIIKLITKEGIRQ